MTTLQWITGFLVSTVSPLLAWLALIIVVWLGFAVKMVGRVHHVTPEDIICREKKEQAV